MLARQIAVGFGIAVIFPLLVYYSVALFVPTPQLIQPPQTATIDQSAPPEQRQQAVRENQRLFQQAQRTYELQMRRFTLILFAVALPVGLIAIVGGGWARPNAIGIGFLLGGITTVGEACYFHWTYLPDLLRFLCLLAGLLAVIYAGIRSTSV
jgi:hypothetical protein